MTAATPSRRLLGLCAALSIAAAAPAAAHATGATTIATGLDNPRGLAFGPGDGLYVAESGKGGAGPCVTSSGPDGDGQSCFGTSGAVTRINVATGAQRRVTTGLPSVAGPDGSEAAGPSDVAFPKGWRGAADEGFLTVGFGGDPATRAKYGPKGKYLAWLYRFRANGSNSPIADLGAYEAAKNPDADQPGAEVDTNPNSVAAVDNRRAVVADAGGNDILRVGHRGTIKALDVIPFGQGAAPDGTTIPVQSVPTSVLLGRHGDVYVGQLTGFPFVPGTASVWKVSLLDDPEPVVGGLSLVTDLAQDRWGNLYVVELSTATLLGPPAPGNVIRIGRDGSRTELVPGGLQAPYGIAIRGGQAYVTTGATTAGGGSVVRIDLPRD